MEESDGRRRHASRHLAHSTWRRATSANQIMEESDDCRRRTPYATPCDASTLAAHHHAWQAPRETRRSCRSAGTHPHQRSTTCWLPVRCVPDHLIGLSTVSLHPPLDMHQPTPHCRVGLPRRRLSEAPSARAHATGQRAVIPFGHKQHRKPNAFPTANTLTKRADVNGPNGILESQGHKAAKIAHLRKPAMLN